MNPPTNQVLFARAVSSHDYGRYLLRQAVRAYEGVKDGTRPPGHPRALGSMACEQLETAARCLHTLEVKRLP